MDTTIKITSLHLVVGIITGIISTGFTLSWFGIKNDVFATALAFIILYFVGQLAQKQFVAFYTLSTKPENKGK